MSYIELRKSFGDPWVFGTCIEIGAGLRPVYHSRIQELFVSDKRQGEEFEAYFGQPSPNPIIDISNIESVFPSGVDSITGHHVIEHLDNPILVIGDWLRLLKEGGVFYFSIPSPKNTSEVGRLVTPFTHVVEDYLFHRSQESYESKQHIYSFCLACTASEGELTPWYAENSTSSFSRFILYDTADRDSHDLHWHTYTLEGIREVMIASAFFAGVKILIEDEFESEDSIYMVARRVQGKPFCSDALTQFESNLSSALRKISESK